MSRTAALLTLPIGIMACAQILGFQDLHERDVACGAAAVCKEAAPSGWTGPVAMSLSDAASAPSCGTAYPDALYTGNHELGAPPAQCGACQCNASGASCTATLVVKAGDTGCTNICNTRTFNVSPNQCVNYNWSCGMWNFFESFTATGTATCTPVMAKPPTVKPAATWAQKAVACGSAPLVGTCPASEVCMASPQLPFPAKLCVFKSGDNACPAGAYQIKTVTYDGYDDTRDCAACGCGSPAVNCNGIVRGWINNSACTTPNEGVYDLPVPKAVCDLFSDAQAWPSGYSMMYIPNGISASCPASGGEVIGEATPSGATTFCCEI